MPKLVIFRHGETEWNEQGLLTGQTDVALTQYGREQATDAGWWIRHIKFDKVYSSSLSRAVKTAELTLTATSPTNDHLKNSDGTWKLHRCESLVERNIGEFSGQPNTGSIFKKWPHKYDEAIAKGESTKDVVERVEHLYRTEIRPALLEDKNIMLVAHAGVIIAFKVIFGYLTTSKAPQPRERVPNAVPWVIEFDLEGNNTKDYLIQA